MWYGEYGGLSISGRVFTPKRMIGPFSLDSPAAGVSLGPRTFLARRGDWWMMGAKRGVMYGLIIVGVQSKIPLNVGLRGSVRGFFVLKREDDRFIISDAKIQLWRL